MDHSKRTMNRMHKIKSAVSSCSLQVAPFTKQHLNVGMNRSNHKFYPFLLWILNDDQLIVQCKSTCEAAAVVLDGRGGQDGGVPGRGSIHPPLMKGFLNAFLDVWFSYTLLRYCQTSFIITIVVKINIRIVKPRGKSIQCHQPSSHTAMWEEAFLGGHKHLPLKVK